ncbi:MBG domain-containing protein, partial [Mediterraneibacter faecis]|uniref:MBG domain-containing protein n=1 Tax=Mediterraneibacter faecis TaxID=592978 RepID=UPI003F8ADB12
MKNAKRCLAILLAVTLLCSNGVSQLGTIVSASELETTEEAQPKEDAVVEQAEETKEDTGKATVEGVTPEEERGESSAQDAETANVPKAAAQEGQNEANVPEAAPATVAPTTVAPTTATPATVTPATAVPAAEGAGQAEEAAAPEVQTYNVKINKSELDGGQIKAWGSDNNKVDVTEYDGNNQYVKEVKEGEEFNFQITLNDGFEIVQVKVNGNAFDPANTEGNVITYKVAGINEEKVIDVTYNKIETPAEEKAAEEPKTEDETKVEEPAAEETAEPEDNSVNTASLNENVSTVANTDTNRTVRVGQTITLDSKNVEKGFSNCTHKWTVNDNTIVRLNTTSGRSITVTGLKAGETIVTDAYTKQSIFGSSNGKKTYTITVRSAVTPTNITIEGSDKVTQFQTMQLTAKLTPADADGTVTWSSSNEQILSVDNNGLVTGKRQGEATVTASVQGTAVSTTKKITVEQDTATTGTEATVFFLLDPTKNPNSNDQSEWGAAYGTAVVNLKNAIWVDDKNCFEDVDQRVISWPYRTNVIPRNSDAWEQIFNNYQATLKKQFGELKFSKDDVEEITLVPAKISKNNGTTSTSLATHLDCSVNIKCKNIALVKYYLFDAGGTGYVQQGAKNYIINDSAVTDPKSVTGKDFQTIKEVGGVTYTFSGWYTDQSLTNLAPEFPAKVTGSVEYYAKYIAGYQVVYDLAGGKFSDDSTSATEKHNVDTMVVVREQPTRAGYKFTGWTVEGLGETTSLNSGATFTMPNGNVTLTAKWEEQKIKEFLTLVPEDVAKPYDGTELQAGTAKVTGKVEGADTASVKIEYSLNGKDWTTNPSEITATNVSDSKTVQVRATSEKYTGELTGTEELTITPKPVTVTANSYNKTYGASDPEFTATVEGTLGSDTVNYKLNRETGEDVGTYKILAIGDAAQGNYSVTYYPGTLTITAATRPEDRQLGVTSYEGVYDANNHTITVNNVLDGDVVEYSYDDGETWTTNLNQYKDVTETTIKVRVTNVNYDPNPVELEGTVTITPKPVTVTANSDSKTYGAADPEFTATVEGTLGSDTVNYKLNRETGEDVGTYKILAIGDAAQGNYSVTYYPGTLTITAATRPEDKQLSVTSYEGVYDANEHTITVDNVLDGDVVEYSYDGGETWTTNLDQYKDVTETTIKVRVTNANYDPNPVELEGTVKITPKPVTVTANSYNKAYGATDPEFTATVEGTLGSDTVNYKLNRETGEDVGTYKILAIGDAAQGNYSVTYYPGTLTITAATRPEDKQLSVTSYEGVYDANEHTITVDNVLDGDVVEYSYDGGETWTTNLDQYKD